VFGACQWGPPLFSDRPPPLCVTGCDSVCTKEMLRIYPPVKYHPTQDGRCWQAICTVFPCPQRTRVQPAPSRYVFFLCVVLCQTHLPPHGGCLGRPGRRYSTDRRPHPLALGKIPSLPTSSAFAAWDLCERRRPRPHLLTSARHEGWPWRARATARQRPPRVAHHELTTTPLHLTETAAACNVSQGGHLKRRQPLCAPVANENKPTQPPAPDLRRPCQRRVRVTSL